MIRFFLFEKFEDLLYHHVGEGWVAVDWEKHIFLEFIEGVNYIVSRWKILSLDHK